MFAPLPPLCKGRGTACGGGIVGRACPIGKRRFSSFTIPQSAPLTAPFTQGSQTGETTSGREPFGTGDRATGREPFPSLQARRRPVAWRAGWRFVFDPALIFACRGFDPPCSRFSAHNKKPVHSVTDRLLYLVCFESADPDSFPFSKSLLPTFLQKSRFIPPFPLFPLLLPFPRAPVPGRASGRGRAPGAFFG